MPPFVRFILKLIASADIDIRKNYKWVRRLRRFTSRLDTPDPSQSDYSIMDSHIFAKDYSHEIPIRIFQPNSLENEDPILFFHGGGWVTGDIETYTNTCIHMANTLKRRVYSVDYRLAPEYPYPAGLEDCLYVTRLLMKHLNMTGIKHSGQWILAGDSAGANLAAAVSLKLRDEGQPVPSRQILLYPVTYYDHTDASPFQSIQSKGEDYGLTAERIQEYMEMYQPNRGERKSPYVSPLMAKDFSNQPRTLIITAEHDPLRDEGEAYGKKLEEAGNDVEIHRVSETAHGFITLPQFTRPVEEAYSVINEFLLSTPSSESR